MSDPPASWARAPLGDLGRWGSGGTPRRTNPAFYDGGTIPWLVIGDLNDGIVATSQARITHLGLQNSSAKLLSPNTLLIAMYGSIGKLGITAFECATNQAIAYCEPDTLVIEPMYLFRALRHSRQPLIALGKGGAQQNINQAVLRSFEIPLAPRSEQKRIADKLDAVLARVDACRERLDRLPAILKRFRQSVLAAATSGKLTEEWRKDAQPQKSGVDLLRRMRSDHAKYEQRGRPSKEKSNADRSNSHDEADLVDEYAEALYELPATWAWGAGADVVEPGAEIVYGIVQPGPKLAKGIPYVRGMDIENGRIAVGQLLKTSKEIAKKYARSSLKGGDVLLGIIRATKVAIVPGELLGANITQGTARYRPSTWITTEYLAMVLEAPATQAWLHAHYRGIDMPGLNLADVRKVPIPIPSREEQEEITRRVSKLLARADRIEARYTIALRAAERLTPSVLAKAFRGELIPQDPSDEPAEQLLARIRAEREKPKNYSIKSKVPRVRVTPEANMQFHSATDQQPGSAIVIKRSDVSDTYLSDLLKKHGKQTPDELWKQSQLAVEEFFELLRDEEASGRLREIRPKKIDGAILLEKV